MDDEKDVAETLAECLDEAGFAVETAANVPAAQEQLRRQDFVAMVLDILMPVVPGIDFLQSLQTQAATTPVIMITGKPTVATAAAAVRLGAYDYLVKPIRKAALQQAVERAWTDRDPSLHNGLGCRLVRREGQMGQVEQL